MNNDAARLPLAQIESELKRCAPEIDGETVRVLADMYTASQIMGTQSQQPVSFDKTTRISIAMGAEINKIMRSRGVRRSLEIGFAYGFSTVWILDALSSRPDAFHIAIDPSEKTTFGGIGLHQVSRLPNAANFEWIEDHSFHALSRLIKQGAMFDFIFIDGNHRFDDVLADFYLSDMLLSPGGLIVFDDIWMSSIRTAVNFIEKNRHYQAVSQPIRSMAMLEKKAGDDRDWRHFEPFQVHSDSLLKRLAAKFTRT